MTNHRRVRPLAAQQGKCVVVAVVAAAVFGAAWLVPQPAAAQAPPAAPAAPAATASAAEQPSGFTYQAEGRRDPFVSLLRRGADPQATSATRAPGLAGLSVAEISLRGVLQSRNEFVGIIEGADKRTYLARAGQKLLDGTIRVIDRDSMLIAQQVNDPLSPEKQRDVRKVLRQDEAK
jgi:Tfp pilus assembly protein PilP